MGSDPIMSHARNFPSLNPTLHDVNEPYYNPDRGILFKGDRYLISDPAVPNPWKLAHTHFVTIEAWVRKDIVSTYDPRHQQIPGIVIAKRVIAT